MVASGWRQCTVAGWNWRQPDATIGWLRVEHHGPTRARASERRLAVECLGDRPITWVTNATVSVDDGSWHLPGLEVAVDTDATLTDEAPIRYAATPTAATGFTLTLRPRTRG